jgi:BirA family transcriptional regulator, biotin operon repressor / biotin---[acetyl-CoA-carboxylase] ligase
MMNSGAIILNTKKKGLFDAINPEKLAACGHSWKQDVQLFGPWKKIDKHELIEDGGGSIWQSETGQVKQTVIICGKCTSSMDVAWHFISGQRLQVWDSVLAVEQTAGRGQRQRAWMSPAGNIHAAWRLPYPTGKDDMDSRWRGLVSLISGYLMARIMRETCGLVVQIKWPNDLIINERKIGGILTEARSNHLVVGIGINVLFSPDDSQLRYDFAIPATNLGDEGIDACPLSLWAEITEKGFMYWNQLIGSVTPDEFIYALMPYLAWVGKKVLVKTFNQDPFEAFISGISNQGGLIVNSGGRETVLYAGSIIPA